MEKDCLACYELRTNHPNLVANGFTDDNCEALSHDLGLEYDGDVSIFDDHSETVDDASLHNKDCEELNTMNDCLIGNMADEVEIYDVCDWQTYMKELIPNMWTMFKSLICVVCGIWENVWDIWEQIWLIWKDIQKLFCITSFLTEGFSFEIGEEETEGSYVVAGKGISFALRTSSQGQHNSDIKLNYVGGGLCALGGSLRFYTQSFQDAYSVYNFDDGLDSQGDTMSQSRSGNSVWGTTGDTANGNELLYEIRINKAEYPEIAGFVAGFGQQFNGGCFDISHAVFDGDNPSRRYAYGQHGHCNAETGEPSDTGLSAGHLVPEGWLYVQMRVSHMYEAVGSAGYANWTPVSFIGIRLNSLDIDCD